MFCYGLISSEINLTLATVKCVFVYSRVMTDKLILIVIILLELGILGGLIYWKFFS